MNKEIAWRQHIEAERKCLFRIQNTLHTTESRPCFSHLDQNRKIYFLS